jgi:hypothetical protein
MDDYLFVKLVGELLDPVWVCGCRLITPFVDLT